MRLTHHVDGIHAPAWLPSPEAPRSHTAGAVQAAFARRNSHRYTQMLEAHHFGMDAEIQRPGKANFSLLHCLNEALIQASSYRPWPRYRHPCRYDGISGSARLVYNGERRNLGISKAVADSRKASLALRRCLT